jgi:two-component system chemotaxis response regulator CheB
MATRDIIVIGAAAGGVQALTNLVADLPADLSAALFIVLHIPAHIPSLLPVILARESKLPVDHAKDEEPIQQRRIYVAPPDQHLLILHRPRSMRSSVRRPVGPARARSELC